MSSLYVRDTFMEYVTAEVPTEKIFDLTAEYDRIKDFMKHHNITPNDKWVGVDFIGDGEEPVTIGSHEKGMWRETGAIYIHVVDFARLGIGRSLITRADAIREVLRTKRISETFVLESVTPANTGAGAAFQFEGGWTAASFLVSYYRDYIK